MEEKILNRENIYYLRYVKMNSNKFFQIVNAQNGDVIFKLYEAGLGSYNIESDDFKKLAKEIAK